MQTTMERAVPAGVRGWAVIAAALIAGLLLANVAVVSVLAPFALALLAGIAKSGTA